MNNIIVTGCAGGIGAATAEKFLVEGYCVTGMDIVDVSKVPERFLGANFVYVQGDLRNVLPEYIVESLLLGIESFSSIIKNYVFLNPPAMAWHYG